MICWKYLEVTNEHEDVDLNKLGSEGWELIEKKDLGCKFCQDLSPEEQAIYDKETKKYYTNSNSFNIYYHPPFHPKIVDGVAYLFKQPYLRGTEVTLAEVLQVAGDSAIMEP